MVFITQDSKGKNFLPAKEFGEPVIMVGPMNLMFGSEKVIGVLKKHLRTYCDSDFLLLAGDPAIIGLATAIAAKYNSGRVNLLKWDRQENKYFVVPVDISNGR